MDDKLLELLQIYCDMQTKSRWQMRKTEEYKILVKEGSKYFGTDIDNKVIITLEGVMLEKYKVPRKIVDRIIYGTAEKSRVIALLSPLYWVLTYEK